MDRILNSKLVFFSLIVAFKAILEISYIQVISVEYEYAGFIFSYDLRRHFLSWLLYIAGIWLISPKVLMSYVSDYFVLTAFIAVLTPILVLYGLDSSRDFFPVAVSYISIVLLSAASRLNFPLRIPIVRNGEWLAILISLAFVLFLVYWYQYTSVVKNFDFSKVYQYRDHNAELSSYGLFSYTNTWTQQVFNVYLIVYALDKRKYFLVTLFFFIQIYFFSASTHKSVLFYPFLILGVWWYFKKYNSLLILPLTFFLAVLSGLVSYYVLDDIWLSSLFSRRVFFVPANLTFVYFDFFSKNEFVYWSNSVLKYFLEYPYDNSVSRVVGSYLGDDSLGANNGYIASGYAHFGLIGVLFYSLLISLIFSLVNTLARFGIKDWFLIALTIIPVRAFLISSDLFTSLLTHGLLISLVLVFLSRKGINN